ncbi:MAG: hypothetical protein RLZZ241_909 [Bacteroidota bacterium]|jgi:3'(2'), 5'-bisphosphate nucleotidase
MTRNFEIAIEAAVNGGKSILDIYDSHEDFNIQTKADQSPLTSADQAANQIITEVLAQTGIPIISEENKQTDYDIRKHWERCWIVDPLDGTKEFIKRNGEFTVNIALCEGGVSVMGIIYVPVSRELYYGSIPMRKSFKTVLNAMHEAEYGFFKELDRIQPASPPTDRIRVVGSRSHMNAETEAFLQTLKTQFQEVEIVSKGSSLKFCLIAEGKADLYPRYAPTMEWDTAAGSAIVEALGIQVLSRVTNLPMRYNKEELLNPHFLVCR